MKLDLSVDRIRLALRDALRELRAAPLVSSVAVLAVAAAVSLLGLYVFVLDNTESVLDEIARDLSVRLYLEPGLDAPTIENLLRSTAEEPLVDEVTYRTAGEEKERVVQLLTADLLTGVDEDAIPTQHVVEVRFTPGDLNEARFASMQELVARLSAGNGVAEVGFEADHVGVIFAIGSLVKVTGSIVGLIALLVALAFVALLVRLGLDRRDAEVALVRSFGGTEGFVYAPTVVSGLLVGLAGGLVAVVVAWLVDGRLDALGRTAPNFGVDLSLLGPGLIIWCLAGGLGLAVGGAWFSIRRHRG